MKAKLTFAWGLFLFFGAAFCVPSVSTLPQEVSFQTEGIIMAIVLILVMMTGGVFIGEGLKLIIIDAIKSSK